MYNKIQVQFAIEAFLPDASRTYTNFYYVQNTLRKKWEGSNDYKQIILLKIFTLYITIYTIYQH